MMKTSAVFVTVAALALLSAAASPASASWYSPTTSTRYLKMAYAAYCNADSVTSWDCKWCENTLTVTKLLQDWSTDTFGYVGYDSSRQQIVVAFRGTRATDLANWITDLKACKQTDYNGIPGASVHSGFYEAYNTVATTMLQAVRTLHNAHPSASIAVTGHSLGAALACLAAADLSVAYSSEIQMWTYGQPRVGNQVFSDWFKQRNIRTWRVVNQHDVVPHLPTYSMGFYHVPTEVWYTDQYDFQQCNGSGEDPNCSDSLLLPVSVHDHLSYLGYSEACD
eukprot:TRINITY_DN95387_c0_g1_i1.p2 TRINITY_DN95387_c0_g1~~TRINITY_DN95387_c0_g1_i1.p2  ORF type:complete len:280 (+),score=122.00 TRINITY_DN95387_c0_g1_i1:59-898(+)